MAGNVFEWAADWYGDYSSGRQVNPTGSSSDTLRVLRGGSFDEHPSHIRCAFRTGFDPAYRWHILGFRCAMGSR
jgi:formylglycine-generating enzyme required for sulfatase activity